MKRIAVICAFYDEIIYFIDKYDIDKNKSINIVKDKDKEIIIANCGIGKVNASMMTQHIIDEYKVDYIINSGCSGAIDPNLKLYQTVISSKCIYRDFTPLEMMQKYTPNNGEFEASQKLTKIIEKICIRENINDNIVFGTIATGDSYVTEQEQKQPLLDNNVTCVDMESAAIAHVALRNNVDFICIRSISDFADGSNVDEIESSKRSAYLTDLLIKEI